MSHMSTLPTARVAAYAPPPPGSAPAPGIGAPNPYAAHVPPAEPTNTLAIVAFVLSLVGFPLIGAILGHVALGQRERGSRGLALAACIIGWALTAISLLTLLVVLIVPAIGLWLASAIAGSALALG